MKRGLIEWNQQELSRETMAARVAGAQRLLAEHNLDAAVAYTSVGAPQVVRYLTHFLPYWNQGVLVLPREGPPQLLVALSNRVVPWIKDSSALDEVRANPRPAAEAGRVLAERGATRVGVIDRGSFPYGQLEEIARALPAGALRDWPALTAALSLGADADERRLRARAAALGRQALTALGDSVDGRTDHQLAGALDLALRLNAAEDTLVLVGPATRWPGLPTGQPLGDRALIVVQVEYKGHWAQLGYTLGLPIAPQIAAQEALGRLCQPGRTLADIAAAARTAGDWELYLYRGGRGAPFAALDDHDRVAEGDILSLLARQPTDGTTLVGATGAMTPNGWQPV